MITHRMLFLVMFFCLLVKATSVGQVCPPVDIPDLLFQDTNFDGIDGDSSHAIFVSVASGNDLNPGTMLLPVKTIEQGMLLASTAIPKRDVYVAQGTYAPAGTLTMADGVSLYGLYDGPPSWQCSNSNTTTINGANPAIIANGLLLETHIEGFVITAANGSLPGQSSYGIVVGGSSLVYVRGNTINAGAGAAGSNGPDGLNGDNGGSGIAGFNGSCDGGNGAGGSGGISTCGRTGGAGGAGGPEGANSGTAGSLGAGGTPGGSGGVGGDPGGPGVTGQNGVGGSNGLNGSSGPGIGSFTIVYNPASGLNGTNGIGGNGGGGGGGGGGQGCFFCDNGGGNGGGGGGAGGCGGQPGGAGGGGGGSFGIISFNSTAIIDGNIIVTSNGGSGGHGGNGGSGGTGGLGAPGATNCTGEVGAGGNGGNGGNGGYAGGGSGGSGGPSMAIVAVGSPSPMAGSNSLTVGSAGSGGSGGTSGAGLAPSGSAGIAQTVHGTTVPIVFPTPSACIADLVVSEPLSGTAPATFTVYLSNASASQVDITYATQDSSAVGGADYVSASGTVSFTPGQVMKQVTVQVRADAVTEPDESFFLRLNVATGATISDSTGRCVIIDYPLSTNYYSLNGGWNLLSLPMIVPNDSVSSVFPAASSNAFSYESGSGYVTQHLLSNGRGYWLKYPSTQSVGIVGLPSVADTVPVSQGWNLVGSVTNNLPTSGITTIPPGLIASQIFGYSGVYTSADTIHAGRGYWVKTDTSGLLVLSSIPSFAPRVVRETNQLEGMNRLRISDQAGNTQTLFFGELSPNEKLSDQYELPPFPPEGGFDARFASQRNVEIVEHNSERTLPLRISASHYPVRLTWEIHDLAIAGNLRIGKQTIDMTKDGTTLVSAKQDVAIVLFDAPAMPRAFALDQNYPNPFNPSTKIRYALPGDAHVRLQIYDLLGRVVATLVDEVQTAGFRVVDWNSTSNHALQVVSGVYFYKLDVESVTDQRMLFTQVRKMVLIK